MSDGTYLKVKRIYIAFFVIMFAIVAASEIVFNRVFEREQKSSVSINIAGRQRMLSQRIMAIVFQYSVDKSKEDHDAIRLNLSELNHSHFDLINGNNKRGIVPPLSDEILKKYQDLDPLLIKINKNVNCLVEDCVSRDEARRKLRSDLDNYLVKMNQIVLLSSKKASSGLARSEVIHYIIVILIMAFLLISFIKFLYPIQKKLIRESEYLKKKQSAYQMMEKVASIGFWELEVATGDTWWSPEVYKIHCVDDQTPTNKIDGIKFYAEHERPRIIRYVENCISHGEKFDDEFEFMDANGKKKWVRSIGLPVLGEGNNVSKLVGVFQDITEAKNQAEILKEKQQYLELAINGASLGIWDWNLIDNTVKFDRNWALMLGYELHEIDMNIEFWEKRVHPEDINQCYEDIQAYKDGKTPYYENVHRMKHKNGDWVYILDRGKFSEFDSDGKPIRFTGTHLDITEAKAAQKELELVLGNVDVGIWKWNIIENILYWDQSMFSLFEVDPKDFSHAYDAWEKTLHPDDKDEASRALNKAILQKKDFKHTFRIITKEGKEKIIAAKGKVEYDKDGKPTIISGINIDQTSETEQRVKLEKSENFLNETLNSMPAIFYAKDARNGEFIKVNKTYHEFFKTTDPEILGKNNQDLFPKEVADVFDKNDNDVILGGKLVIAKENAINSNEEVHHFHSYKFPYFDKDQQIYAIGGISIDVTDQKILEEQLRNQAKFASIGQLAAGVGHEINNPLAIIKGYLTTIQNKNPHLNDSAKIKFQKIDLAISRIKNIVTGLRAFSRDEGREVDSRFSPIRLFEETIFMIEDIYRNDGIELSLDITLDEKDKNYLVNGSRGKIQQVLINLLGNAKDAIKAQDVKKIEVNVSYENQKILVKVKDNGAGVPKEIRDKIFDPFFTTKEVGEGTGIGLSLSYQMMQEHEGNLYLTDAKKGTEFVMEIPCTLDEVIDEIQEDIKKSEEVTEQLEKFCFLIAEDEEDLRDIIIDFLDEFGFEYEAFANGKLALAAYKKNPKKFQVILSDMKMPELDGPDLLKEIRSYTSDDVSPYFFFMTGGVNTNLDINQFEYQVDGIMYKPFEFDEILGEIKKISEAHRNKNKGLTG